MNKRSIVVSAASLLLLASCQGSRPIGQDPGVEIAQLDQMPSPTAADYRFSADAGVVRPLDRLAVDVFGVPDLTRSIEVTGEGSFSYPLIGRIDANGRTPEAIADEIADRLRGRYVLDPEVTVTVAERSGQLFTVGGEVKRPGQYPLPAQASLMSVVAIGGGTTDFAKLDDVLIFRTVGGQRYIGLYNLKAIQRGNYGDPAVYPQDIIIVGDSPNRRLLASLVSYTSLLTAPTVLIDRVAR